MSRRSSWRQCAAPTRGRHLAALSLVAVVGFAATTAHALTFRVDSPSEELDATLGDGVCGTLDGTCTLRAALEEADALKRPVEIVRPALADPSVLLPVRSSARRALPRSGPTATFVVDTTADAADAVPGDGTCATAEGACSLRAAIMEANDLEGPQAITLPAGHYTLIAADPDEDESTVGDLDVLDELTITGAGADVTTIDGDEVGTVLDDYGTLTLTGVTITEGAPYGLAGWYVEMTVTDCDFVDNETGINQSSLFLTLTRGHLTGNGTGAWLHGIPKLAIDGTTVEDNGRGIEFDLSNHGTVMNALFRGNGSAAFFGVANEVTLDTVEITENGFGFGIGYSDLASYVTVENCRIANNTGGAVGLNSGSITMSATTIRDNGGCAISAGSYDGGSIALTDTVVERNACGVQVGTTARRYFVSIVDTTIVDNRGVGVSAVGSPGSGDSPGTSVTIERSTIARNGGGGVQGYGVNGFGPRYTITDTTIAGNTAERGGAILIDGDGRTRPQFTLVNSTVSGNSAPDGDGILNAAGDLDLRNVTLAGNGLVVADIATTVMRNTILAGACHGTFASAGYNVIATGTGCTITGDTTGDQSSAALLGPLAENGGPTATHALLPGSPAHDGGNPAGCVDAEGDLLTTDQRGSARAPTDRCDVGAFEAACGNGSVDAGETCDDGNDDDGDCCSSTCQLVAGACGPCLTCNPSGACVAAPWTGCHQPTERLSGELELSAKPTPKIEWNWVEGEATTRAEIGDPLGDSYAFCLFDESQATPRLAFRAATHPDPCGKKKSCWKAMGKTGFQYSAPTSDALRKVVLKSGSDGKAKVQVTAKGADLALPSLPLSLPLRAQLQAENGQCWEARFFDLGVAKNTTKLFRGKAFLR